MWCKTNGNHNGIFRLTFLSNSSYAKRERIVSINLENLVSLFIFDSTSNLNQSNSKIERKKIVASCWFFLSITFFCHSSVFVSLRFFFSFLPCHVFILQYKTLQMLRFCIAFSIFDFSASFLVSNPFSAQKSHVDRI